MGRFELRDRRTLEGQSESLSNFSDPIHVITLNINTGTGTQKTPGHLENMSYGSRTKKKEGPQSKRQEKVLKGQQTRK